MRNHGMRLRRERQEMMYAARLLAFGYRGAKAECEAKLRQSMCDHAVWQLTDGALLRRFTPASRP
jgi:hypothetical protein